MHSDVNRSVFSRYLKVPTLSADLADGDRVFQTVGAAIETDLSAKELMSGGYCSLSAVDERKVLMG